MNEITIFHIEGSTENFVEKSFVTDEFLSKLPSEVIQMYQLWRMQTSVDGTGLTIKVWYKDFTYCFTNHYWD